jgi:DNA-binding MarR family transcriptional regulator
MAVLTRTVHDIIERLGNLVRADVRALCHAQGVRPVQFEALHYLSQCNRYSDTPQAVTEFLGLTKGTVSQTLKVLEEKGLLVKRNDKGDKRVVHLKPTARGRRLIEQVIPSHTVASGIENLSVSEQQEMVEALQHLLRSIQKSNGLKTFASCHTCRFNQKREGCYFCELTQEPLEDNDVTLLCREHQYPVTGTSC